MDWNLPWLIILTIVVLVLTVTIIKIALLIRTVQQELKNDLTEFETTIAKDFQKLLGELQSLKNKVSCLIEDMKNTKTNVTQLQSETPEEREQREQKEIEKREKAKKEAEKLKKEEEERERQREYEVWKAREEYNERRKNCPTCCGEGYIHFSGECFCDNKSYPCNCNKSPCPDCS